MTETQMYKIWNDRAKELLTIPEVRAEYMNKESEAAARDWILHQALITLMYSHEERMEMLKLKNISENPC